MNTETGKLLSEEHLKALGIEERSKFIPVARDLSEVERMEMQIRLYSLCGCGSGRKFKFCCHSKPKG